MTPTLEQIAEVRSGAALRGPDASRPVPLGPCKLIRISDISPAGALRADQFISIKEPRDLNEFHYLRPGDVLFACRGTRHQAAPFLLDIPNAIVGTQFFVLRPRSGQVLPEYLSWAINTTPCQRYLAEHATGSHVQLIPSQALKSLPIPLPPLEIQRKIAALHQLSLEEHELTTCLLEKRNLLLRRLMENAVAAQT